MNASLAVLPPRSRLKNLFVLISLSLFVADLSASTLRETLAEFESGATTPVACGADQKIGRSKEVSRFQILPVVWRQYSQSQDYSNPETAWRVTERILRDRRETFRRATGRDWNDQELYLMWNAPGAFARANYDLKKLSRVLRERADRFGNLASRDTVTVVAAVQPF